jgi:hypothetical protein
MAVPVAAVQYFTHLPFRHPAELSHSKLDLQEAPTSFSSVQISEEQNSPGLQSEFVLHFEFAAFPSQICDKHEREMQSESLLHFSPGYLPKLEVEGEAVHEEF